MKKVKFCVALRTTSFLAVLGASSALAQSTTYVVDANGGPGVNFTDLPAAVAAAQAGDVIAVRSGAYSAFTLGRGVTIVGESGVVVDSGVQVAGLPANERAVFCVLDFGALKVSTSGGNVTFDECSFTGPTPWTGLVTVESSADVRLHRCKVFAEVQTNFPLNGSPAVATTASRVELSSCNVRGGNGIDWGPFSARPGGVGIDCYASGRVHVALTDVTGGKGGKGNSIMSIAGANGGDGIRVRTGGEVIVAGVPNDLVRGGDMGAPYGVGTAHPGHGVQVDFGGSLRYSGATIASGGPYGGTLAIQNFGTALHATPNNPTLEVIGNAFAGASVQLAVHGVVGVSARLQQGNQALVVDDGQTEIERLDNRIRLHPLGLITTGSVYYTMNIPSNWPVGFLRLFQGQEVDPATGALLERTNSVFAIVH